MKQLQGRERAILWVLILLVAVGGFYNFVYSPKTKEIAALTKQLKQRPEVFTEPRRVAGTSARGKRWTMSAHRKHLVAFAQLLDPVDQHPPAGRE